jgi:transcriptional regulator with XRE-family HTH domain
MKNRKNIVGPNVRRLRNNQDISQEKLAAKCQLIGWDISREGIAKIESQIRGVSDIELLKLAKALRVHFSVLFP